MPDSMKCCFCGAELRTSMLDEPVAWYCPNRCIGTYEPKVWRALITGEKAQHQLRTVKDRCAKKIKAKEREIANYLNGISVRDKEIQDLCEQLQKAQDALLFISNIRGVGMSYQDMFLDAQAVAKYASGRTSDLILVGRYAQDELNGITKQGE